MASVENSTGVPVICMESPRGVADPGLGAFAEVLAQADCILLLGKRLDFTLKFGRAPAIGADCGFLQVDAEDDEIVRTRHAVGDRLVHSTMANPFDAAQVIAKQTAPARSGWRDEVRSAIEFRPAAWAGATSSIPQRLHPVQALGPLQALLDAHPDSVFVSDGGEFGQWAQACLRAPNRVINGVAGAIGPALPFAVAARLAKPNAPVIAAMGDGTFGFHASEIDTAARYVLPFLAVVGNDACWNAEHQIQIREYGAARALGTDLAPTRYDEVARGFGGYGELVTEPRALLEAAKRAAASGLPAVLNVMIEGLAAPNIKR
jgi:acetolactate synthase-1/2/3 large subunit